MNLNDCKIRTPIWEPLFTMTLGGFLNETISKPATSVQDVSKIFVACSFEELNQIHSWCFLMSIDIQTSAWSRIHEHMILLAILTLKFIFKSTKCRSISILIVIDKYISVASSCVYFVSMREIAVIAWDWHVWLP